MTAPFPAPQRRGPRVGLILGIIGLVAVLCCGGAVAAGYVFRDRLSALAGQGDSGQGDYRRPEDACVLINGNMGEQAGPVSDWKQLDNGCLFTFAGESGTNELRVFVTVDDAVHRFNEACADFGNREGFVGDVIADLGDEAFFTAAPRRRRPGRCEAGLLDPQPLHRAALARHVQAGMEFRRRAGKAHRVRSPDHAAGAARVVVVDLARCQCTHLPLSARCRAVRIHVPWLSVLAIEAGAARRWLRRGTVRW